MRHRARERVEDNVGGERVERLDEEGEELRSQLAQTEEERDELQQTLDARPTDDEVVALQQELEALRADRTRMPKWALPGASEGHVCRRLLPIEVLKRGRVERVAAHHRGAIDDHVGRCS